MPRSCASLSHLMSSYAAHANGQRVGKLNLDITVQMVCCALPVGHLLIEGVLIGREVAQQPPAVCEHCIMLLTPSLGARHAEAGHL